MRRHSGGRRYNPLNNKIYLLLWVIIVVVVVLSAVWWQFLSRTSADTVAATRKTSSATKCAVIFDAGRSWSRVHVYCFNDALELVPIGMEMELFVQIKPGLSSFAFPREAAHSLVPLLKKATAVIPPKLRGKIPVIFGATSGLRRLGTDLENILQRVRHLLELESSLKSQSDWTKVLNGTQEGAYQWVTINYLIGNLGKTYAHTVGVIDLRDDSVQMAYAISEEDAAKAPQVSYGQDLYVQKLSLKGTTYYLYVHSYPHYGLLAVRLEILKANKGGNNCILQGYQGTYKYGDNKYDASAASSGTSYTKCRSDVVRALKVGEPACTHVNCTFGGAWNGGGGDGQKNLYLASFFFDKAAEAGFVNRQDAVKKVKVLDLEVAAKLACKMDIKDAKATYPFVSDDNIPYLCMDLVYQFTLLVDGFGVDPYQEVSLIKKVKYGDAYVEAAWTLGSAIEVVSLS